MSYIQYPSNKLTKYIFSFETHDHILFSFHNLEENTYPSQFSRQNWKKHLFSKQILKWLNINCREQKIRRSDDDKVLLKDGMSLLKTSQQTGMPYTTLHDYLRGKYVGMDKSKYFGPKAELTTEEEESLLN